MKSAILSIRWSLPHQRPPNGKPLILWSRTVPYTGQDIAEEIARPVYDALGCVPGCGYAICISIDTGPVRRWPKETKARVRRNRLKKRLDKKLPLLAEQLFERELAHRPDYFAGHDPAFGQKPEATP